MRPNITEALSQGGFRVGCKGYRIDDLIRWIAKQTKTKPRSVENARKYVWAEILNAWPHCRFNADGTHVFQAWFPPLNSKEDDPKYQDYKLLKDAGMSENEIKKAMTNIVELASGGDAGFCVEMSDLPSHADGADYKVEWSWDEDVMRTSESFRHWIPQPLALLSKTAMPVDDHLAVTDNAFRCKQGIEHLKMMLANSLLQLMINSGALVITEKHGDKVPFVAIKEWMLLHFNKTAGQLWHSDTDDQYLKQTLHYNKMVVRFKNQVHQTGTKYVHGVKMDATISPPVSWGR